MSLFQPIGESVIGNLIWVGNIYVRFSNYDRHFQITFSIIEIITIVYSSTTTCPEIPNKNKTRKLISKLINFQKSRKYYSSKISIFDQSFDFWPKIRFLTKIVSFDKNCEFWPKLRLLIKDLDFSSRFRFFIKISIFNWNLDFLTKNRVLTKNLDF